MGQRKRNNFIEKQLLQKLWLQTDTVSDGPETTTSVEHGGPCGCWGLSVQLSRAAALAATLAASSFPG